jgi:hypothetical protein
MIIEKKQTLDLHVYTVTLYSLSYLYVQHFTYYSMMGVLLCSLVYLNGKSFLFSYVLVAGVSSRFYAGKT